MDLMKSHDLCCIVWYNKQNITKRGFDMAKTILYASVNDMEVPRRHFKRVEREMLEHYGAEKNYTYTFDDWIMRIWSNELPDRVYEIDLKFCCGWEFDKELGIKFEYDNVKKVLYFGQDIDLVGKGKAKKVEFFGMNELA